MGEIHDREALVEGVRRLYVAGEVEAINVYARLEGVCSGAEISGLIREWDQQGR